MRIKERNYSGKKVFVGIDVHKKRYVISTYCDGLPGKKWSCIADATGLPDQLQSLFKEAEIFSAYEAGFSGFSLHRKLLSQGIKSIVVNAASIEVASNDRVKTDKRDASKIAEQLASGRLRGIYIPTEQEEACRSLSRGRQQVVERRKAIGNQIKMKLHYLGVAIEDGRRISESFLKWIEALEVRAEHRFALAELIDAWRQESKRIIRFNQALQEQAAKDSKEEIYRSAPGIGPISARILSNELGDMSRFDNERQLFSATGLTPSEYSSGDHIRRGHISRQGSARVRGVMVEVAWRAIAADFSLKEFYSRLAKRRDGKRAIVAVARKMLGRLRYCLQNNIKWQDQSLALTEVGGMS